MRILRLFLLLWTLLSINNLNAQDLICSIEHNHNTHQETTDISQYSQTVYVCTGVYAYVYHSRSDCPGLGNCKEDIRYTDENYAVNSMSRVPCCRCWSNVSGRCKDDNPNYSRGSGDGGDNSEAYAYLAIAFVAASAAILSNDLYLYPTYSFHNNPNSDSSNGAGWTFGFRKTFKHSALEYGASYLKTKQKYNYGYGFTYNEYGSNYYETYRWGGHFNFVHQVFYNKTPYWLKLYFGPSVNYVYDFGYGGIIGTEMILFDRVKFDVRYEYTTQTNQIQAGLIFTYQKEYFWNK